jgi:hypothetical protein
MSSKKKKEEQIYQEGKEMIIERLKSKRSLFKKVYKNVETSFKKPYKLFP